MNSRMVQILVSVCCPRQIEHIDIVCVILCLAVLTQYRRVTDRQTDRHTDKHTQTHDEYGQTNSHMMTVTKTLA